MYKFLATFILGVSLLGCAVAPTPVLRLDAEKENQARNFQAPPDVAKVYFFGGDRLGGIYSPSPHGYKLAVYLNSILIARINPTDTLVYDLKPGTYTFGWNTINSNDIPPNQLTLTVSGGQTVFLRGDFNAGGGSSFGLIGAAIAGPHSSVASVDKSALRNNNYVATQSCPESICITKTASITTQAAPVSKVVPGTSSGGTAQQGTASQKLRELNDLLKNGLITQKDYDLKKASILKDM